MDREDTADAYIAAEAARFRLLASTVNQSGNDSFVLGTHDSNLIYRDLRDANLSVREKRGLLSAGLENFDSSTVPIWHWLFEAESKPRHELPYRTIMNGDRRKRSAFQLLEKLSITPNEFEGHLDWAAYQEFWFSEAASDDLVVAALDYLGSVGDNGVGVNWLKLIGSSEANIARAAVRASARITARTNTAEALQFVSQHESIDLGSELAEELLANVSAIETEILRGCLKNKTASFLQAIAAELNSRAALTRSDAKLLCESADANVRLIGVRAFAKHGPAMTLADARKLLVKPAKTNALALLTAPQDIDYPGESAFKDYQIGELSELSLDDLRVIQKDESFFSTEATLALYSAHFRKNKSQLEVDLVDGFVSFCEGRSKQLLPGPSASVFNFVRNSLLQSALELFCSRAAKPDLATVRKVVDKFEIKFSAEIAEFLSKHGDWEDAVRLAKLSGTPKYGLGFSVLSIVNHATDYRLAAKSILKLGTGRIADAWKLELSTSVRVQFVIQMPKKLFSAFDNQSIIDMLLMESDIVREVVALKSVLCLSKSRLRSILNAYYKVEGSYYYNAIFWLDLGVSADQATSKAVALKEIRRK